MQGIFIPKIQTIVVQNDSFPFAIDCCRAPKYLHTINVLARDHFTICALKSETTHSSIIISKSRYRSVADANINF